MTDTSPVSGVTTWRGGSGRLYACAIHPIGEMAQGRNEGGVAIAVKRDAHGVAQTVAKSCAHLSQDWITGARKAGATEIHVHQPDGVSADPRVIADDLRRAG